MKDTVFSIKESLILGNSLISIDKPMVMGIVNLTPDSFYEKSRKQSLKEILETCSQMLEDGADLLDLGAYSSRPGAEDVVEEEELKRLMPALEVVREEFPKAILSIDTFRATVAEQAIVKGADIINDISGCSDEQMPHIVAKYQVPYILMHTKGTPKSMQKNPQYEDVLSEVFTFFKSKLDILKAAGAKDIILDPGFGFGKTVEHNYTLLNHLEYFKTLGFPILAGISRKSMITKVLNNSPSLALNGTTALNTVALLNGASFLRVHDVREAKEVVQLVQKLKEDR